MPKIPSKASFCWSFFKKIDSTTAKCNLCSRIFKTAGNTTNMQGHLRNIHQITPEQQNASKVNNTSQPLNTIILKDNSNVPARSNVIPLIRQPSIQESFYAINDFAPEGQKTKRINEALTFLIAKDLQPFSIVENEGFTNLMATVAPQYKMPSRYKVTAWVDEKYNSMKTLWKHRISGKNVTLTTDIWSDSKSMRSFLGITAHFEIELELSSLNLGVLELSERHTGEYLSKTLLKFCEDWDIPQDNITAVVTDNGSNVVKAVELAFGKQKHIPCFAHTINLIARSVFRIDKIDTVVGKVKGITTFFKQSCVASDELRKRTEKRLIQDVVTRWNSTFYMIERFLEVVNHINDVLVTIRTDLQMVTGIDLDLLSNLLLILRPLEEATRELSDQKYCTAGMIILVINILITKLSGLGLSSAEDCKDLILLEIDRRMGAVEKVPLLAAATILDPRFKKIHFRDPLYCANACLTR